MHITYLPSLLTLWNSLMPFHKMNMKDFTVYYCLSSAFNTSSSFKTLSETSVGELEALKRVESLKFMFLYQLVLSLLYFQYCVLHFSTQINAIRLKTRTNCTELQDFKGVAVNTRTISSITIKHL